MINLFKEVNGVSLSTEDIIHIFGQLLPNVRGTVYIKDLEGRYVWFNDKVREYFNLPEEEIKGENDLALFKKTGKNVETAIAIRKKDQEIMSSGVPEKGIILSYILAAKITSAAYKSPLRDAAGKIIGLFGLDEVLSEEAQQSFEKQEKMLQQEKNIAFLQSNQTEIFAQGMEQGRIHAAISAVLRQAREEPDFEMRMMRLQSIITTYNQAKPLSSFDQYNKAFIHYTIGLEYNAKKEWEKAYSSFRDGRNTLNCITKNRSSNDDLLLKEIESSIESNKVEEIINSCPTFNSSSFPKNKLI